MAFAKSRLFDFSRKGLLESDNVLAAAYEVEPRGSFLAWRGFIRATARFEFLNDRFLEKLHDDELFVESLASDPRNSYSRTFAAQHYYIGGESPSISKLLLSEAIETNKLNTLAWGFMANAEILSGDPSRALEYAKRGFSLSQNYLERGFLGLLVCVAATASERYDEAEKFAGFAVHFSPNLVPAKRYRFALSLRKGDCSKIQKTMQDMRAFEPDFDAKRLMDPSYPVKTMQSLPIMESIVAAA